MGKEKEKGLKNGKNRELKRVDDKPTQTLKHG